MSNVINLFKKHTPLEIAQQIPWPQVKKCIVIYEVDESCPILHVSEMEWRDRVFLSGVLQNYNIAEAAVNLIEFGEK